jgi:NAD(P)-dependent dehydrogenase (short-subunit alcohol dehydrogenase family)
VRRVHRDATEYLDALGSCLGERRANHILALLPMLRHSDRSRIVNVSSEGGSLTNMGGGIPAYRATKAALNALTRMLAAELRPEGILVNAVGPGWSHRRFPPRRVTPPVVTRQLTLWASPVGVQGWTQTCRVGR